MNFLFKFSFSVPSGIMTETILQSRRQIEYRTPRPHGTTFLQGLTLDLDEKPECCGDEEPDAVDRGKEDGVLIREALCRHDVQFHSVLFDRQHHLHTYPCIIC